MGFSSQDDLINEITSNGKLFRADWNKNFLPTTAALAGEWHSLFRGGGNPGADAILNTGTNLAFQALTDATANATGIQHGGNVSRHPSRSWSCTKQTPISSWNRTRSMH